MVNQGAEKYKLQGNEEFKKGNHGKAIEYYTYATEMDPNNHIYYTNRSNAYFKMGVYDKSLRDALKSTTKNSAWHKGYYRAGLAYQKLAEKTPPEAKMQDALEAMKKALQLDQNNETYSSAVDNIDASMKKGMCKAEVFKSDGNDAFKKGDIELAKKKYTLGIKAGVNMDKPAEVQILADCYANRAACNRQLYHDVECVKDCSEALKLCPNHVKAYIRRAQGYESQEKYEQAYADFQKASQLAPNTPVAYQGVSRVRTALKKIGKM